MDYSKIYHELREKWGIKPIQIKILTVLEGASLTVNDIVKKIGSKKQVAYPALNELADCGLIKREDGMGVQKFSCLDLNANIDYFINSKSKEFITNQGKLIKLKKDEAIPYISKVTTQEQYSNHMINMFNEESFIKIVTRIHSVPYELYGSTLEKFSKYRTIIRDHRDVLSDDEEGNYSMRMEKTLLEKHNKGISFEYIVTAKGVRNHFEILKQNLTKREFKNFFLDVHEYVKNTKGLNIHVVDDVIPTEFIMSRKHLLLITKSKGYSKEKAKPIGLFIESRDMVNGYCELWDDLSKRGIGISHFLDKIGVELGL